MKSKCYILQECFRRGVHSGENFGYFINLCTTSFNKALINMRRTLHLILEVHFAPILCVTLYLHAKII